MKKKVVIEKPHGNNLKSAMLLLKQLNAVLDEFASLIRERDGGNVSWHYFSGDVRPEGCDFYLLTSLQFRAFSDYCDMELSLLVTRPGGNYYSRGLIIIFLQ